MTIEHNKALVVLYPAAKLPTLAEVRAQVEAHAEAEKRNLKAGIPPLTFVDYLDSRKSQPTPEIKQIYNRIRFMRKEHANERTENHT